MTDDFIHSIPESSCFFQGHIGQFFSRKFNKSLSFRIQSNYSDLDTLNEFNVEKYRPVFSRIINRKIALRKQDGGDFHEINPDEIKIEAVKLIDNVDDEGACGWFEIYPPTALCTKDNCHHYFTLKEGRKCGHKDTDPWEQFTFLAFCDECGRLLPLHYMTNIFHDCKKCGEKKGLSKLRWTRGKDDISSYKIKCKRCGNEVGLYFYDCDHTIRQTGERLSNCEKNRFRGVPARANAIIHPLVISIPDIPQEDEIDKSGRKTIQGKSLSEAFTYFFGYDIEESKLYLPEFKDALLNEEDFWRLPKVNEILEDISDELEMEISDKNQLIRNQFLKIIKRILKSAKMSIQDGANEEKIKKRYGLEFIEKALNYVKDIDFDENDLQGLNLLCSNNPEKREEPKSFLGDGDYDSWLCEYGLKKVVHYPDLTMVQALLGIIEGSTRREKKPLLFRAIETGKRDNKKPTVFVRNFQTEGILFQLDYNKILDWLQENGVSTAASIESDIETQFRHLMLHDPDCRNAVNKLLHTYSHMLIQQSTIDTGLDIQSLSEIIYPKTASVFIYSTNSINIGGLEYTYDYHLEDWFSRMRDLAGDCPQDPGCMVDEGGACNACSYVPEFVCCNFNQDIDRSTLVGGSERFAKGYL